MAFDYTNLYPDTSGNGGFTKSWNYTTLDPVATVVAANYFNIVASRVGIGDNIFVSVVDTYEPRTRTTLVDYVTLYVTGISAGVVTVARSTVALDAAIALKANIASPTFTGVPAAPTAAVDTNTTQLATTAMVLAQAASATPAMDDGATAGTSTRFSRGDHVHPVDTSRQATLTAGQLVGTATNDNASAGNVGEYVESNIALASVVSLTSPTAINITSISLTAGDWDISASVTFSPAATTNYTLAFFSISLTTGTQDSVTGGGYNIFRVPAGVVPTAIFNIGDGIGPIRKSLSATTTIYLVAQASFTVSTMGAYGILCARRVR